MITINLTTDQYCLIVSSLGLLHKSDLETIEFYSSSGHFNKEELDGFREESDKLSNLLEYLHDQSFKAALKGVDEEDCEEE